VIIDVSTSTIRRTQSLQLLLVASVRDQGSPVDGEETHRAGAEAHVDLAAVPARLKSCPDKKQDPLVPASHPSRKDKSAARVGHPVLSIGGRKHWWGTNKKHPLVPASHPSRKDKSAARVGHPVLSIGGRKHWWGTNKKHPLVPASHPSRKNKSAARVGHPVLLIGGRKHRWRTNKKHPLAPASHPSRKNKSAARVGHPVLSIGGRKHWWGTVTKRNNKRVFIRVAFTFQPPEAWPEWNPGILCRRTARW
jgi:hypothetical protein